MEVQTVMISAVVCYNSAKIGVVCHRDEQREVIN